MTEREQRQNATDFSNEWRNRGNEKKDTQKFWLSFAKKVLGIEDADKKIDFEKDVKVDGQTKFIDAYIAETNTLIEQKSLDVKLDKPEKQSDGAMLTPFEQGRRYCQWLSHEENARWIIACNFKYFEIHDMNKPQEPPVIIELDEIRDKISSFKFMFVPEVKEIPKEEAVSKEAGILVGRIYDALLKQYIDPKNEKSLKSLNILCVRLVFCLYAEDAVGVFGKKNMFHDYMVKFDVRDMRKALKDLFKMLDTKPEDRDPYDNSELSEFPYVNGGLFTDEDIEIPNFTEEIKAILLEEASEGFDWSVISPTIFGALFEATLNPETRHKKGMHYTTIECIHKVIDPLFLDDLHQELDKILSLKGPKEKQLSAFQDKLASIKWLDPACGSGNFLTETYISIRRLENEIIKATIQERSKMGGQYMLGHAGVNPIKVSISQFFGIEINDFACTVAKAALWIAESQMMKETEDILVMNLAFLPLKTNAFIHEGNALRMDWNEIIDKNKLTYIMGNPPFLGYSQQENEQKEDILSVFVDEKRIPCKNSGKIDYVAAWYHKAAELMQNTNIKAAFVSTNSITQGEQVASIWSPLYSRFGVTFNFAHQSFVWNSETVKKAQVHCVIIGFSVSNNVKERKIYNNGEAKIVERINPYLTEIPVEFLWSRTKPICNVPEMITGNRPADGGHLIIEAEEYDEFISKEPGAIKYIKKLTGAEEYINGKDRYCLWLVDAEPSELRKMPEIMKRVELCRQDRLKGAADRKKLANTPTLFRETRNPSQYIIVPATSSENRNYIPLGFLDGKYIPTNSAIIIPDAGKYEFGILTSNVHMAWMKLVAGRLEMRYRYSKDIVYNNFPWPNPTKEQKEKIEETAQAILDARAKYPKSTLADLYDKVMPKELVQAHIANDRAVMKAYGFWGKLNNEADCVAELMKMYKKISK